LVSNHAVDLIERQLQELANKYQSLSGSTLIFDIPRLVWYCIELAKQDYLKDHTHIIATEKLILKYALSATLNSEQGPYEKLYNIKELLEGENA
jgi:hypothetical protein